MVVGSSGRGGAVVGAGGVVCASGGRGAVVASVCGVGLVSLAGVCG